MAAQPTESESHTLCAKEIEYYEASNTLCLQKPPQFDTVITGFLYKCVLSLAT